MNRFFSVLVLALSLTAVGALMAKTPDGQPPSKETPCAGLSRSAFGICNAYCEAQDCDVHPRPSCERLRANFKRATGSDKFPCDRVACGQAAAPTCDGDCPDNQVCQTGVESGGPESGGPEDGGPDSSALLCRCLVPCGDAVAPQCNGACPLGSLCLSGPEAGGPEVGGPEDGFTSCACVQKS
jgi:hypothetical protein